MVADGIPNLEVTFDTEDWGVNYKQLYALDLAEWHVRSLNAKEIAAEDFPDPDLGAP